MDNYNIKVINLAGLKDIFISSTGYTGAGGFEILVNNNLLAKHDFKDFIFDKSVDITDNCNFIHKI